MNYFIKLFFMLDNIPTRLIFQKDCNDWILYSDNLLKYNYVNKYLGGKLKYWVENLKYPLEVTILYNLFLDRLNYLEDNLKNLERYIGKTNLLKVCEEIELRCKEGYQVNKRIISLGREIDVFNELKKESEKITKINRYGDWEINNKIVSVKTITDIDYNYVNIENTLKGMLVIKNNEVIREHNEVRILNAESLNYSMLEIILEFLRSDAVDLLEYYKHMELQFPEIGEQKELDFDKAKIHIDTYFKFGKKQISFTIMPKSNKDINSESITIVFAKGITNNSIYSVMFDTYGYFREESFDLTKIAKRIQQMVDKISYSEEILAHMELWIVISLHDKHSDYVMNKSEELTESLKNKIDYRDITTYFLVVPQFRFDIKENIKIKLN